MVKCLKNKSYEERLRALGSTTLWERPNRGDTTEVLKRIRGLDGLHNNFLSEKKNSFTIRVIQRWNCLPARGLKVNRSTDSRMHKTAGKDMDINRVTASSSINEKVTSNLCLRVWVLWCCLTALQMSLVPKRSRQSLGVGSLGRHYAVAGRDITVTHPNLG